jgi:NAD-dependent SIR2 family protein deacetylase
VSAERIESRPDAPCRDALRDFARAYPRLFVLSGAGVSTDSGIPGYRDARGRWLRAPPVLLHDYLGSEVVRQRYWARSMRGWPRVASAAPNPAHRALARLEAAGHVRQLATQNVDGLHRRAGSVALIELHGNVDRVRCLDCGAEHARSAVQRLLEQANPQALPATALAGADGDAEVELPCGEPFRVPVCPHCAGVLKPDVVFFGEGVPRARTAAALQALEQADALLVVGSSLMVYSGYRFCLRAAELAKPIAAVNLGQTRADALLALKVNEPCALALGGLAEALGIDPAS